jgi:hypothetical protein
MSSNTHHQKCVTHTHTHALRTRIIHFTHTHTHTQTHSHIHTGPFQSWAYTHLTHIHTHTDDFQSLKHTHRTHIHSRTSHAYIQEPFRAGNPRHSSMFRRRALSQSIQEKIRTSTYSCLLMHRSRSAYRNI